MNSQVSMSDGYSRLFPLGKLVIENCQSLISDVDILCPVDQSINNLITLCDYGCADGGSSLDFWKATIKKIKNTNATSNIHLIFNDLPWNNWNSVAKSGQTLAAEIQKSEDPNFTFSLAPGSIFGRVLPDATLGVGFSCSAMHYMSRFPNLDHYAGGNQGGTHVSLIDENTDLFKDVQKQWKSDWERNITERLRELKPGGYLLIGTLCTDENGHFMGNNGKDYSLHQVLSDTWQSLATREEFSRTMFPTYHSTKEEALEPFQTRFHKDVSVLKCENFITQCPYRKMFDQKQIDTNEFVNLLVRSTRVRTEWKFREALEASSRSQTERDYLVEDMYKKLGDKIRAHPERFSIDAFHTGLVIFKNS